MEMGKRHFRHRILIDTRKNTAKAKLILNLSACTTKLMTNIRVVTNVELLNQNCRSLLVLVGYLYSYVE